MFQGLDNRSIATPVSHHFQDDEAAALLMDLSDALELRDNSVALPDGLPYLYHSRLNIAEAWDEADREHLGNINVDPVCISFHLDSRYRNNRIEDGRYLGIGEPYTEPELVENVCANAEIVREVVETNEILVENNNHLGTDAYDIVTGGQFISRITEEANLGLLLDVGHARLTAANTEMSLGQYLDRLPCERCRQLHVSRPAIEADSTSDDHSFLQADDWALLASSLEDYPGIRYVTLEYYQNIEVLADQIQRLRAGESDRLIWIERWDTEFFGETIGTLRSEMVTPELLAYIEVCASIEGIDCLYYDHAASDGETAAAVTRWGFDRVDTQVVFERAPADVKPEMTVTVGQYRDQHLTAIQSIARNVFAESRFHEDRRFSQQQCDKLYEQWITNACQGYADEVLVAEHGGKVVGFITCSVEGTVGDIGLVGVVADEQGHGVGHSLVTASLQWFNDHNVTTVKVRTQERNEAAKTLYKSTGFNIIGRIARYHWWL